MIQNVIYFGIYLYGDSTYSHLTVLLIRLLPFVEYCALKFREIKW